MCPEELVALATSVSIALAKNRTVEEIDLLAVIFSQLSCSLATISFQKKALTPDKQPDVEPVVPPGATPDITIIT